MRILLISDIHANFVALEAVAARFPPQSFDLILNGGDSLVYGPFPNETIDWLKSHGALSILGNTDCHVITLLKGSTFKKPRKAEKRIMYGWTAAELSEENRSWLCNQPMSRDIFASIELVNQDRQTILAMHHGSPADPDEFLFATTPACRYQELAKLVTAPLVTIGHSHQQFTTEADGVTFINPGSTGRMFDGKISGGCAMITVGKKRSTVDLYRIPYSATAVADEIRRQRLPSIYVEMFLSGRKLN
ncbi:MAG: metallophosphoesterase family protein [Desulfofustis sp.]|nr:metallophosphoesterase family protein [Desulfofustis sp.]